MPATAEPQLTPSKVWEQPAYPDIVDLDAEGAVEELLRLYCNPTSERVLRAVISQALDAGAHSAIVEVDYTDRDFRSEYAAFYAATFRDIPSKARRLHFFADVLSPEFLDEDTPTSLTGLDYVGYTVLRPVRAAPTGRTMIRPTEDQKKHLTCVVRETVGLFGHDFHVEGFPFMAQDAELAVCAHASAWSVAHYHHLRYRAAPRITPAALVGRPTGNHGPFPQQPATLSDQVAILGRASLPSVVYDLDRYKDKPQKLNRILCRYLDSGIPVIVFANDHALTAVGYRRNGHPLRPRIELLVHDDETGPYVQLGDPGTKNHKPWYSYIVPVPEKLWTRCETAELVGIHRAGLELPKTAEGRDLAKQIKDKVYSWRTVAIESSEFKKRIVERQATAEIAVHYQRTPMPRWIWVVELIRSTANQQRAIGELIIDATSHNRDAHVLLWRLADQFYKWDHNHQATPINVNAAADLEPVQPHGSLW